MKLQKFVSFLFILFLANTEVRAEKYRGDIFNVFYDPSSTAMGSTGIANFEAPTFITINPALSPFVTRSLYFSHSELFSGFISIENLFLSLNNSPSTGNFGIMLNLLHTDKMEVTTSPFDTTSAGSNAEILGRKSYWFYKLDLVMGKLINENGAFGLKVKLFGEKFYTYNEKGVGVDIGYFKKTPKLNIGLVLRDALFSPFKGTSVEITYPSIIAGFSLKTEKSIWNLEGEIYTDGPYPGALYNFKNLSIDVKTGLQYQMNENVMLRLGFYRGFLSAGAGIKYRRLVLDYSITPHTELQLSHKIGLGICL